MVGEGGDCKVEVSKTGARTDLEKVERMMGGSKQYTKEHWWPFYGIWMHHTQEVL